MWLNIVRLKRASDAKSEIAYQNYPSSIRNFYRMNARWAKVLDFLCPSPEKYTFYAAKPCFDCTNSSIRLTAF
jgi:hypothetical protein